MPQSTEPFTLQPIHISQGHYIMSVTANRLLKMAIQHFDWKTGNRVVKFTFSEYFRLYGLDERSSGDKEVLADAVKELIKAHIEVYDDGPGGSFTYIAYTFFSSISAFRKSWGKDEITLTFSDEITGVLADYIKSGFSMMTPERLRLLDGKYQWRFYEIALSRAGQKQYGKWWFEYSIKELRDVLKTGKLYKQSINFKTWVIDESIKAINEAHIGLHIDIIRPKLRMSADDKYRFECSYEPEARPIMMQQIEDKPPTRDEFDAVNVPAEMDNAAFIALHREEYDNLIKIVKEEKKRDVFLNTTFPDPAARDEVFRNYALIRLRKLYP